MSDFIASSLHKKVDHLMDIFFGAGVASHPTIIEQINYLLFMRALSQKDEDLKKIGVTDADKIVFDGELDKYHWDNLLTLNAEQLFVALEECFRKIPESTTNRTVRLVFRNAHIKLFDKPSLRTVVHELDAFAKLMDDEEHDGKRDIFGDTYEYLLSKLSQAGTSGQFRTPRHIIEFLVAVIAPQKSETILDPAVGTAGFLVKAFEYLRREYTSPEQLASGGAFDKLSSKEHSFLYEHTFNGFDSDEDMIKFGMMNLYLHGLQNARMLRQNTLTDTAGSRDKYDIILANPPFSGKIDRDSVAEELQMNTSATEVLFLRYMMRHLTSNGRAGIIVPEGVLHNNTSASKQIRELLIEAGVWCIVELPHGMFKPYASVKTHIVFIDKQRSTKDILFLVIKNDGFSQTGSRRPVSENDLPEALQIIKSFKLTGKIDDNEKVDVDLVPIQKIQEDPLLSLVGRRYIAQELADHSKWDSVRLEKTLVQVTKGKTPTESTQPGPFPLVVTGPNLKSANHFDFDGEAVCIPLISSSGHGHASVNRLHYFNGKFALANIMCAISVRDRKKLLPKYLYYVLSSKKDELIAALMTGTSNVSMSKDDIHTISIPLPPIDVQKKILDELEEIDRQNKDMRKTIDKNIRLVNQKSASVWEEDDRL